LNVLQDKRAFALVFTVHRDILEVTCDRKVVVYLGGHIADNLSYT